ncbi:MAG: class I SAM-dependent RNA methyltransferase [Myxococcales bacterium]
MPCQIQIESLAYGGAGVGRIEGRAVFVDGAAPGDRLEVELSSGKRRPERARLLAVLSAGAARIEPRCPHYGDCGGCQWQHVEAGAQLEAKRRALEDALVRLGRVPRDELPEVRALTGSRWRHRRRARLAVAADGRLGFSARGSHRVVAIESCALLEPALERLALKMSHALQARPVPGLEHVELVISEAAGSAELQIGGGSGLEGARAAATALLAACPELSGLVLGDGRRRLSLGDPVLREGGLLLRPDVFAQASREGNRLLVREVLAGLGLRGGERVLELYCGSGNFTFAIAEAGATVLAVEEDGLAIELARRGLPPELESRVTFVQDRVARALRRQRPAFEAALLDPPRAGAKEEVVSLAPLVGRRIVYVSCDPSTLARDVERLRSLGFQLVSALALDLFPQTFHLEAVVVLEREPAGPGGA